MKKHKRNTKNPKKMLKNLTKHLKKPNNKKNIKNPQKKFKIKKKH